MHEFICNSNMIFNWNDIINKIELNKGYKSGLLNEDDVVEEEIENFDVPKDRILETDDINYRKELLTCGYDWKLVKWQAFIMHSNFPEIVKIFSDLVKLKTLRCFITRLDPGYCAPYHWDECDGNERTETNIDKIYRYVCFINKPNNGQIIIIKDHCFYNEEQGNIYKWNHYTNFHGAFNTSNSPHYLFHFVGTTDGQ